MIGFFVFAATVDVALTLFECLFHPLWLPLGGTPASQLGVTLGCALVLTSLIETFRRPPK
jgi:hypothetical protein